MTEDQVVARLIIWINAGDAKGELETEASRAIG
jgi:hypothetical protein